MITPNAHNRLNKCFSCVCITLFLMLELLMLVCALLFVCDAYRDKEDIWLVILCLLFSIFSIISLFVGSIGCISKNKNCWKISNISSIISTVFCISIAIYFIIGMFDYRIPKKTDLLKSFKFNSKVLEYQFKKERALWGIEKVFVLTPFSGFMVCISSIRAYFSIKFHRFVNPSDKDDNAGLYALCLIGFTHLWPISFLYIIYYSIHYCIKCKPKPDKEKFAFKVLIASTSFGMILSVIGCFVIHYQIEQSHQM
eukprot:503313_1